jgi:hypothetical protein
LKKLKVKKNIIILSIISLCSICSGYLLSKATLPGRVGIDLFYKQYRFLRDPLKSSILILMVYLILFTFLGLLYKRSNNNPNKITFFVLLLGLIGAILTYYDFQQTLTHKLLGSKFHVGGYIFWAGWMSIPIFYIVNRKSEFI